ncbi:hypothetical protein [Tardiphaga sp.]|uniref:hypothetical protein n=1 Tax=Tardiphaga sp. TaxID=1926292 RepID=UPI00352A1EFB
MRETVTIYVPDGYASSNEFLDDCAFECFATGSEDVAAFNDGYAAGVEDRDDRLAGDFNQIKRLALDCKPHEILSALSSIVRICIDADKSMKASTVAPQQSGGGT